MAFGRGGSAGGAAGEAMGRVDYADRAYVHWSPENYWRARSIQ